MMATSMLLSSILHVTIPLTLHHSAVGIVLIDFLRGLAMGPLFPACIDIWRLWAPTRERTTLVAITFSVDYIGRTFCYRISTFLCDRLGETGGFFTSGFIGIIWSLLWLVVIYESPSSHPHITQSELQYLQQSLSPQNRIHTPIKSIPMKSMMTSLPVIAVIVCFSVCLCAQLILFLSLSMFDNYSSAVEELPVHLFWPAMILGGVISDVIISRTRVSTTLVRKITNSGGLAICGVALACSLFQRWQLTGVSVVLATVFLGCSASGLITNTLEISPKYACLMIAVGETLTYAFLIAKWISLKYIISNEIPYYIFIWNVVKGVFSGLCIAGAAFYALIGSGMEQPWSAGAQGDARAPTGSDTYPEMAMRNDLELSLEEKL